MTIRFNPMLCDSIRFEKRLHLKRNKFDCCCFTWLLIRLITQPRLIIVHSIRFFSFVIHFSEPELCSKLTTNAAAAHSDGKHTYTHIHIERGSGFNSHHLSIRPSSFQINVKFMRSCCPSNVPPMYGVCVIVWWPLICEIKIKYRMFDVRIPFSLLQSRQ